MGLEDASARTDEISGRRGGGRRWQEALARGVPRSTSSAARKPTKPFLRRLEGHVSGRRRHRPEDVPDSLAVAVEKMDAKLAEKCGKSCARRLKRGIPATATGSSSARDGRQGSGREAHGRFYSKRLDDLRFDFDLSEDAFASGTLRDLGWLLPRMRLFVSWTRAT